MKEISLLLVDDDPDISWGLGRSLLRAGIDVSFAGDGAEAIRLLEAREFDVAVCDLNLPEVSGIKVISWAAEHRPALRVVVITGYGSPAVKRLSLEAGAAVYLEKPVSAALLIDIVRRMRDEAPAFSGAMVGIPLIDVVQMLTYSRHSAVLEITTADGVDGRVHIELGRPVQARFGDLSGESALLACLTLHEAAFVTLPWQEPEIRSIDRSGEDCLLEAARLLDERRVGHRADDAESANTTGM